jgi:DinB superfamily
VRFNLDHTISILASTPQVLRALLENLPPEWITANEGEQTWSPFDVVGHLVHGERTDWIPRLKIILEVGEAKSFEPFDRYAQFAASRDKRLGELLDTFEVLRRENILVLEGFKISSEDMTKRGKHPELGIVTVEELIATWVVHDLDHVAQITRSMAKQYVEAVGPWKAYLSILK